MCVAGDSLFLLSLRSTMTGEKVIWMIRDPHLKMSFHVPTRSHETTVGNSGGKVQALSEDSTSLRQM